MTCFYFIYFECFNSFGHIPTSSTKHRSAIMLSAIRSIILQDLIIPPKGTQILLDAAASQDKAVKWYNDGWHDLLFGRHSKRLTKLVMIYEVKLAYKVKALLCTHKSSDDSPTVSNACQTWG